MNHLKKILSVAIAIVIIASICVVGSISPHASGTGAGLAEWALGAYYSGWSYVYGGSTPGAVDCSGLIWSYCGGNRTDMLGTSTESGYVSSGVPRVHGLGLYQPGHVGVYIGDGMAVDARNEYYGVCYESIANKSWTNWFKFAAISYIDNGWEKFNGNYYYYENGQYLVNTSREIGGIIYEFNSTGISDNGSYSKPKSSSGSSSSSSSDSSSSSSSSSSSTQSKVLKVGSYGDKVTKLQNRLTELGFYDGVATGYFGEATEASYKKFQEAAGVIVDGIAGESDLDILYSDYAPYASSSSSESESSEETTTTKKKSSVSIGDFGDSVTEIQQRLAELNYFGGEITGYFGEVTQYSVMAFQGANGLGQSGIVGKKTKELLFSEYAVENPEFAETEEEELYEEEDYAEEEYVEEEVYETEPEYVPETEPVNEVFEMAERGHPEQVGRMGRSQAENFVVALDHGLSPYVKY